MAYFPLDNEPILRQVATLACLLSMRPHRISACIWRTRAHADADADGVLVAHAHPKQLNDYIIAVQ